MEDWRPNQVAYVLGKLNAFRAAGTIAADTQATARDHSGSSGGGGALEREGGGGEARGGPAIAPEGSSSRESVRVCGDAHSNSEILEGKGAFGDRERASFDGSV